MEIQKNMSNIMNAIKESRRQSLTEFSEELEISRSSLQQLLDGTGNPSLHTIEHISQKLGIAPAALLLDPLEQSQQQITLLLLQTIDAVSKLDPEKRKLFAELFQQMIRLWETDE